MRGLETLNFLFIILERKFVMEIGEKIKRLRLKCGLTQEELADRAELSKGFISQLERDLASPSIATLSDVLECLGSTLSEFFGEKDVEKVTYSAEDMFENGNKIGNMD